jgi:hypothetical protein
VEEELGTIFESQNEPGDIAQYGKYKNQPRPYGRAMVVLQDGGDTEEIMPREALRWVGKNMGLFRQAGATEIYINVVVGYVGDCSFGMSPDLLKDLSALGIDLNISCYEDEDLAEGGTEEEMD